MRAGTAIAGMIALAGCSGASVAGFMPGESVTVGGDSFTVTHEGTRAVARNFATGAGNQDRLYQNAQAAITIASGCEITNFTQDPGVNTYRALLSCGAE